MEEEEFELQYADELEALEDIGPDENDYHSYNKSKKSLKFKTPNKEDSANKLTSNFLPIIESPIDSIKNSSIASSVSQYQNGKRGREYSSISDDEQLDDVISFKNTNKRPKLAPDSDEDVLPSLRVTPASKRNLGNTKVFTGEEYDEYVLPTKDVSQRRVLTHVPCGDFISATNSEKKSVYLKVNDQAKEATAFSSKSLKLLPVSINDLRYQLEEERSHELIQEAERITQDLTRVADECPSHEDKSSSPDKSDSNTLLWVEKYTPRHYTDLLSEELVNRSLLHWIKLWDYCVFGKELKKKDKKTKEVNKKFFKKQSELLEELDKLNRPLQKIAILCGPPGLGKTTLAHILAKHAGYNPVEINASDDRSAEVFKTKIEASTQMKSVLDANPRPNCLILDEIDGAPQPAVNALLNIMKRGETQTGKQKEEPLLRPIICICNDLYVPSLRQLRQLALIVTFPQTDSYKLAARLQEITKREQLRADINVLLSLCNKSGNDIRTCLNTLQFIQGTNKELNSKIVQSLSIGNKDVQKSLFSLWNDVFSITKQNKNKFVSLYDLKENPEYQANVTSLTTRFQNILQLTYAAGEYDKVVQGLFENYPEGKFKDPHLQGLTVATDWLVFVDLINQYTGHSQDYSLMGYVPFITVVFHLLFASNAPLKVQYPHKQFELMTNVTKTQNLITTMFLEMSPQVKMFLKYDPIVMEILTPLMEIIQPNLRPVNTQLYSAREKEDLSHLIQIMIAYNINYRQEKNKDGQYMYVLDPNIEEIADYPGTKQRKQLTYAAKQLVSREITLEKMRKKENSSALEKAYSSKKTKNTAADSNNDSGAKAKPDFEKKEHAPTDFFGRVIKPTVKAVKKTVEKRNVLETVLWFRFQEGFSNAVRRNVRVQDFL